ncbi:hypothetical protein F5Y16DRAFT_360571 [Xylariaceae sp. FL0255]|nr:hypothetical protein F5Y16DRAFT_360571 [Xylariaceae sp. FL0255]
MCHAQDTLRSSEASCLLAASPHLSSLTLESSNSLLSPLSSHLGDCNRIQLAFVCNTNDVVKVGWTTSDGEQDHPGSLVLRVG